LGEKCQENSDSNSGSQCQNIDRKNLKSNRKKARSKLFILRIMAETMLVASANSTWVFFGFNHMCCKHNVLFIMEHVEHCDEITACTNIRRFAKKLKEENIRDWDAEERR
jgi:hypothetical protein